MKKIEKQLTEKKNEEFELINTPIYMFCTFLREEAFLMALKENQYKIDGFELEIKRAKQPTNIIWENREISNKRKISRVC